MYFEELKLGDKFGGMPKTITEMHLQIVPIFGGNRSLQHFSDEFARELGLKGRNAQSIIICSSPFNGLLSYFGDHMATHLQDHFVFRAPVYIGDTIISECEIIELTPKSRFGVAKIGFITKNQDGVVVLEGWTTIAILYKPKQP